MFERSKKYSTKSLYNLMAPRGVVELSLYNLKAHKAHIFLSAYIYATVPEGVIISPNRG
jgi:hypothetical protein